MKISLVAVGGRMPAWVDAGCEEYRKRLPKDFSLSIVDVPLAQRSKTVNLKNAISKESEGCLRAIGKGDYVIALDVLGKHLTTEKMAVSIQDIREQGKNISFLVGGPDGLSPECKQQSDVMWSLSALTMSHPVVRVVFAEQLYRVWTVLNKHPYHRKD